MNPEYWKGRWARGETGWHQAEFEPKLLKYFSNLAPTRVLVPLCGKSLDLIWLANQGHTVMGIELSLLACVRFFEENQIPFTKTITPAFTQFSSESITIYCGDFFKMTPAILGSIGAVYDRAALIALPPEVRSIYTRALLNLIQPEKQSTEFRFLQLFLNRKPRDDNGPPFSINPIEFESYYSSKLKVTFLESELTDSVKEGAPEVHEYVYLLERK